MNNTKIMEMWHGCIESADSLHHTDDAADGRWCFPHITSAASPDSSFIIIYLNISS